MDALLTRQFNLITTALGDTVPAVRAAAARGVCSLLDQFWELIPATVSVPYLKRLTGDLQDYLFGHTRFRTHTHTCTQIQAERPFAQSHKNTE